MRITVLVVSYPPIVNSAARLYSELSESLAEIGCDVTVITSHPSEGLMVEGRAEYHSSSREVLNGVTVLRVPSLSFLSKIPGGKPLRYLFSSLFFGIKVIFSRRPDVVLVYSPPLYMGIVGYVISAAKKTRSVFNMQDIHPKVLFDMGAVKKQVFKKLLLKMEKFCYKNADLFIVYSTGNKHYLVQAGVDPERVYIVPNWVDTDLIVPSDRMNAFRKENGIGKRFVVSYAGSMGRAQGLEVILEAAQALSAYKNIVFLLAGDGGSKALLKSLAVERDVRNLLLLPAMTKESYVSFLNASDVCLLPLNSRVPLQTVPGKLAEIMAAGRPVIASVKSRGDAAKIIRQAECGFCVEPGDANALSEAVLKLYRDKDLREKIGRNARVYAEHDFSRTVCIRRYEEILRAAASSEDGRKEN